MNLKNWLVVAALALPVVTFASVKYQMQVDVPGLKKKDPTEVLSPDVKFYVDYSKSSDGSSVVEQVSGQTYPAPAGAITLDDQGKYAYNSGVESGLPDLSLNLKGQWEVELIMAPPYGMPTTNTWSLTVLDGAKNASNPADLAFYRDGDYSDALIYQTVEPHSTVTEGGAHWELHHSVYYRLQNKVSEPIKKIVWKLDSGYVSVLINGNLYAKFPALPGDNLVGSFNLFAVHQWQNPGYYKIRSLKISGKEG